MKIPKVYLDTSVINFLFADDAPEKQEITIEFFNEYINKNLYTVFISPVVVDEINKTKDDKKREQLLNVIKTYNLDILDINDSVPEIQRLANSYIAETIIPEKKLEDALHIAICTVFGIDVLLSWNFKHLSNINKERLISSINIKNGYSHILRLVTPMEVMYDD